MLSKLIGEPPALDENNNEKIGGSCSDENRPKTHVCSVPGFMQKPYKTRYSGCSESSEA